MTGDDGETARAESSDEGSGGSRHVRFAVTLVLLTAVVQVLAVVFLPPDPYSQFFFFGPVFGVGFLVSYWLAYRGGFERLGL